MERPGPRSWAGLFAPVTLLTGLEGGSGPEIISPVGDAGLEPTPICPQRWHRLPAELSP